MIWMTRVRLINWHNFIDETLDFKAITYFLGLNAVGKTTILDGIRYCLTTNKEFNTAGNRKTKRTLQGSVHQKQRAENEYLRPGHTVAYIGIEFRDDTIGKHFTITSRIESESPSQELRHVVQDWYISKPGYTLEDLPFFIEEGAGKRPSKREEFRLDNHALDRASSQSDARRRICRQLGIGDAESNTGRKFNKVFHMGTSLKDIEDIRQFIYTYILPDPEMNIEGLYKDMQELENLQEVLEESRNRAELLAQINDQIEKALDYDSRVHVYEALLCYAQWQAGLLKRKTLSEDMESTQLEISVLNGQIQESEKKCEDVLARWMDARTRLGDDENHQKMESLAAEMKNMQEEYGKLKENARKFDQKSTDFERLSAGLANLGITDSELLSLPAPQTPDYQTRIYSIRTEMNDLSEIIRERYGSTITEIRQLDQEIQALAGDIRQLEAGRMVYPDECREVLDEINRLFEEHGIQEKAKLLCELLHMVRPEWQDAVESYLNTQRFYVIVPPQHYQLAKQVFVSMGDRVKDVGLVDTVSLQKRNVRKNDSDGMTLADTVDTGNPYARAFVDFRLGDVYCCDSADDLEKYKKSITVDRLRYQGYVLQRIKRRDLFIGQDAIRLRLEQFKKELAEKQERKEALQSSRRSLGSLDRKYQEFMAGDAFTILSSYYRAREDAEVQFAQMRKTESLIKELEQNPIMKGMIDREADCHAAYEHENSRLTDKKASKKEAEKQLENIALLLTQVASQIEADEEKYREKQKTHSRYIPDMEREYEDLSRRQTPAEILAINQTQGVLTRRINDRDNFIRENLLPLQQQYNAAYSHDYLPGLDGLAQYQEDYQTLTKIDIERNQANLRAAQVRCKERFRKEVLFRMKDDIERARRLFRELNRVMTSLRYGEEQYEFFISGSKDKELQIFYNLIMDKDNRQIREEPDLFTLMEDPVSEVFESQIEEFMQRIMVEVEVRTKQNVEGKKPDGREMSAYADYRTYLDYDILVKNTVTGQTAYLSKVSGDGSGGESQAPFYVAICASLLQIYQQSENCIRLLLLDEAFNNMTSDRIKPMMEMFRDLNLQVILIATPEKCSSIYPLSDVTYSIVKRGSRNNVAPFIMDDK